MAYIFDEEYSGLIFAEDYLRSTTGRGGTLRLNHLGLTFYGLTECVCLGGDTHQIILPESGLRLQTIFKESCQYLAGEHTLAPMARRCLEKRPEFHEEDEAAAFFNSGSHNLWHWMTEALPKLLALESIGYSGKYIVPESAVARQSLALLGIKPERLLPGSACFRIKRLMLPQRLSGFDMVWHMPLVELTRDRVLEAAGQCEGGKRVYVKRIGRRKPANEEDVLSLLEEYNFAIMVPEECASLKEQISSMTNVDCSVMPHGANSTLTLFQKPRSGFVEFFSNRYVSYTNLHAVRLLRLRYNPMVQDLDVSTVPVDSMTLSEFMWSGYEYNMTVDIMHLRVVLETLLS